MYTQEQYEVHQEMLDQGLEVDKKLGVAALMVYLGYASGAVEGALGAAGTLGRMVTTTENVMITPGGTAIIGRGVSIAITDEAAVLGAETVDAVNVGSTVIDAIAGLGGGGPEGMGNLAKYGDEFGKMGKYVERPNIKLDWDAFAEHGWERMQERDVTQDMVETWVKNGKVLSQNDGDKFAYITKEGVAIVSKDGKLITTWGADNFDDAMQGIIDQLYGK